MINNVEIKNTKWKKGIGLTWTTFSKFSYININIQRKLQNPSKEPIYIYIYIYIDDKEKRED